MNDLREKLSSGNVGRLMVLHSAAAILDHICKQPGLAQQVRVCAETLPVLDGAGAFALFQHGDDSRTIGRDYQRLDALLTEIEQAYEREPDLRSAIIVPFPAVMRVHASRGRQRMEPADILAVEASLAGVGEMRYTSGRRA